MNLAHSRKLMIEQQIKARGIKDERVLKAMLNVQRHEFIPEKLWNEAYSDYPLPIGHSQTISQPYIVAMMTELLELNENKNVLEIGTGSGYQTAVLAEISKEVVSIERIDALSKRAKEILKKYKNIKLVIGDGTKGYEEDAPYDSIIVTAAAEKIYPALTNQLQENGILVIPVEEFFYQKLLKITKTGDKLIKEHVCDVRFVPLVEG